MRILILILFFSLVASVSFANECIVNTTTDIVREWTSGVYCGTPPMSADEELKVFKSVPYNYTKVLKYENGDIVVTNINLPVINKEKEKFLGMLDDSDIIEKIKKIKP